ncbi:protein cereblon-like [Lycorma delicatula]|uniref:protein cereblon-like n=1 Tax=Lycorma delicatula TaxID=130591 RepID=UPI003F5132C3
MVSVFLRALCIFFLWGSSRVVPIHCKQFNTPTDFLLCRQCGTDLASAATIINKLTPAAESRRNDTLFGLHNVQIQTVVNPFNIQFQVISVAQSTCVATGQWQVENSWYPGYAWKVCSCSHCNQHLGWLFEPLATAASERKFSSVKGFYSLILDNIISEKYSDSLLATPKYSFHLRKHQEL